MTDELDLTDAEAVVLWARVQLPALAAVSVATDPTGLRRSSGALLA